MGTFIAELTASAKDPYPLLMQPIEVILTQRAIRETPVFSAQKDNGLPAKMMDLMALENRNRCLRSMQVEVLKKEQVDINDALLVFA